MPRETRSIDLDDFESQRETHYRVYAHCRNCDWAGLVAIPKGTPAPRLSILPAACSQCGCQELLRPSVDPAPAPVAPATPGAGTPALSRYTTLLDGYREQQAAIIQDLEDRGWTVPQLERDSSGSGAANGAGSRSVDAGSPVPEPVAVTSTEGLAQALLSDYAPRIAGSGFPQSSGSPEATASTNQSSPLGVQPAFHVSLEMLGQLVGTDYDGHVVFQNEQGRCAYRPESLAQMGHTHIPIGPHAHYDVARRAVVYRPAPQQIVARSAINVGTPNRNGDVFAGGSRWSHSMLPLSMSVPVPDISQEPNRGRDGHGFQRALANARRIEEVGTRQPATFFGAPVAEVDMEAIAANHAPEPNFLPEGLPPNTLSEALGVAEIFRENNAAWREAVNRSTVRRELAHFGQNSLASEPLARNDTPVGTPSAERAEEQKSSEAC